jgi:hypothetical protein
MLLIDVFDRVLESELEYDVETDRAYERTELLTLAAVEVKKS